MFFEGIEFFDIEGFTGRYALSKCGKIYSYYSKSLKSIQVDKDGYCTVSLTRTGDSYKSRIRFHRLMAITFIPNPDNKPEVNHKDGDKQNNSIENLEWVTNIENIRHARDIGLQPSTSGRRMSFFTQDEKETILLLHSQGISNAEIARRLDTHKVKVGRFIKAFFKVGSIALFTKKPNRTKRDQQD